MMTLSSNQIWILYAFFVVLASVVYESYGREAIKPPADVEDVIKEIAGNVNPEAVFSANNGPPCSLDIQKDLNIANQSQPLYLIPDTNQFWLPNDKGQLQIPRGATIELFCTKAFANATNTGQNIPKHTRTLRPVCLQDKSFLLNGEKYELRHFTCAQPARFSVERTNAKCGMQQEAQIYRVGFNITRERFIETMRMCHDDDLVRTHYTQHLLQPANLHYQKYVKRLNFSKAGFFNGLNMNFLYTKQNQRAQATKLVLSQQLDQLFDETALFLARGHLAAKSDMIYASQQRSTFTFFNAAPQWQSFNAGQWAALEDEVRKFIAKSKLEVDCYTGTWGTLELASGGEKSSPFYLHYDANNNGLLPVPKLFYRVLIDRRQPQRGLALVGVNDAHASMRDVLAKYLLCDDVREQVPWLRWIRNKETNLRKGYLYACRVNEFAQAVQHLPKHLSEVKELLVGA